MRTAPRSLLQRPGAAGWHAAGRTLVPRRARTTATSVVKEPTEATTAAPSGSSNNIVGISSKLGVSSKAWTQPAAAPPQPPIVAQLTRDVPFSTLQQLDTAQPQFLEAELCRLYYFSEQEQSVVLDLKNSMKNARSSLLALAAANVLLSLSQAAGYGEHHDTAQAAHSAIMVADSGLTVGDVAYWADSILIATMISYALGPFRQVVESRGNQMAYCFQGINRLSLTFQQLTIGSFAVTVVTGLEAAAKFPALVPGTSAVFFGLATIRAAAMFYALNQHAQNGAEVSRTLAAMRSTGSSSSRNSGQKGGAEADSCYTADMPLLDRVAVFLAFGYLLQFEEEDEEHKKRAAAKAAAAAGGADGSSSVAAAAAAVDPRMYEFSLTEERLLRGLTESASWCGIALGLQAFVTLMLTVADAGVNDLTGMASNGINFVNKAIMAALLASACTAYDRALHTAGSNDVEHLMDGLGHKGITGLFESLAVLSWAVTVATLAGLAMPFIEDNVLARAVGDGLSHRTAERIVEVLEWARAIVRAL